MSSAQSDSLRAALVAIAATWTNPTHHRQDVRYQECIRIARGALADTTEENAPMTDERIAHLDAADEALRNLDQYEADDREGFTSAVDAARSAINSARAQAIAAESGGDSS